MSTFASTPFRNFQHGLMRKPPFSMANGITTQNETVDFALAQKQHQAYESKLRGLQLNLTVVTPEEDYPDCHFVEDAAIVYGGAAIMTRPGAPERRSEGESLRKPLATSLTVIDLEYAADATVDGGDILFMGQHVLIGISDRTTLSGAKTLANTLTSIDATLLCHFIEFSGVLHLKSGLTALNEECLLANTEIKINSPLPRCKMLYVPSDESYAANALVINGSVLYFAECKRTGEIIASENLQAIPMELTEFKKMDGSFTCLSLLW